MKPFHREQTAEFCSSCHKVHLDKPVNDYRWFRGFNDYDNWQASGVSGRGRALVLLPAASRRSAPTATCRSSIRRTRRPRTARSARTASPAPTRRCRSSTATRRSSKAARTFLQDGQVTVDVFGLVRARGRRRRRRRRPDVALRSSGCRSTFAVGEESRTFGDAPALLGRAARGGRVRSTRSTPSSAAASRCGVEVVVRTRKVGHFFPGGTVDAFDVWVELEVDDDRGRRVSCTAALVEDGGQGPGRSGRALLPLPDARRARQSDQQAQCLDGALGRLRPADSAGRRRHRALPPADARRTRGPHHRQGEAQLPQVRLVEHAVGVCRRPRSRSTPILGQRRTTTTGSSCSPATRRTCPGAIKAIPDIPATVMATATRDAAVVDAERRCPT